jgi:hypothetical protein
MPETRIRLQLKLSSFLFLPRKPKETLLRRLAERDLLRIGSNPQMKRIILSILLPLVLVISSGVAQTPAAGDEQRLLALIQEVQTQQAQIEANQAKIDSKLAQVTEAVRQARIYARRGK